MACKHPVFDTDKHFIIDSTTKKISTESPKIAIPQHTHKAERFTFEIARMVEGHDMSLSNVVNIHFQNVSATDKKIRSVGIHKAESLEIVGDNVVCSWLLEGDATEYEGILMFALHFSCVENGVVQYNLPTLSYSAISVGATVWNSGEFEYNYSDVIAEFESRITALEQEGTGGNVGHVVRDTPPEDTSVLWVDPTDNSDDGFHMAINAALAQAKASGEFDGTPGQPGKDGKDYVLTPDDKNEIAELAAEMVEVPTDEHINSLINTALGVIENGTY